MPETAPEEVSVNVFEDFTEFLWQGKRVLVSELTPRSPLLSKAPSEVLIYDHATYLCDLAKYFTDMSNYFLLGDRRDAAEVSA